MLIKRAACRSLKERLLFFAVNWGVGFDMKTNYSVSNADLVNTDIVRLFFSSIKKKFNEINFQIKCSMNKIAIVELYGNSFQEIWYLDQFYMTVESS